MTTTDKATKTTEPTDCECSLWEIGCDVDVPEGAEPDVTIETTGCTATTNRVFAPGHDAKLKALLIRAGVEGLDVRYGRVTGVVHTTDWAATAARFGFEEMVRKGVERGVAKAQARLTRQANKAAAKPPRKVGARVVSAEPGSGILVADLDALVSGGDAAARHADSAAYHKELADNIKSGQGDPSLMIADESDEELLNNPLDDDDEPADDWRDAKIKVGRWVYSATIDIATGTARYTTREGEIKTAQADGYVEQ